MYCGNLFIGGNRRAGTFSTPYLAQPVIFLTNKLVCIQRSLQTPDMVSGYYSANLELAHLFGLAQRFCEMIR
jgi:hypothetical protein